MSDTTPKSEADLPHELKDRRHLLWRVTGWCISGLIALILLAGITVTILLHNERFHNYVLGKVQQQASEALGVRVQLKNFVFNLSQLDLDLYGLTVDGAAPYQEPSLLQVDHVEVGIGIVSILRGKWYLNSFRVDRPIVHLFVDDHGRSNIPALKSSGNSTGNTNLFDLGIRRAVLDHGEIYYNDHRSQLAADFHNVEFRASFNVLEQKYSGKLAYTDGHLTSGSYRPVPHNLSLEFDATPTTFHLTRVVLSSGSSQVLLTGTVQNYANPDVDAHYDMTIDGSQVGQIFKIPSIPAGQVHAAGDAHYQKTANNSFLDALTLSGQLNSSRLNVKEQSLHTQISDLVAHYSFKKGNVVLQNFSAKLFGGRLTGSGTMNDIGGNSHAKINAKLNGISLAELKQLTGTSLSTSSVSLTGVFNAELAASWGKSFNDLVAHTDAVIDGRVGRVTPNTEEAAKDSAATQAMIPIDGVIHGTYTAANKQIALDKSYLRTPQTNLTMNGVISNRSSLDLRLQADDLREIEYIADLFQTPSAGRTLQPLGLAGTASFQGTLRGSTAAPDLSGRFAASDIHLHGSEWKVLHADIELSPTLVNLQRGDLEPASRGHITFNASARLTKWTFTNLSPAQVDLDVSQLNVADLEKLIGQQIPVTGTLAANIKLHGTETNPAGNGTVSVSSLVAYGQPVSSLKLTFGGAGDQAHADLAVQLPAGSIQSKMTVRPQQRTYIAQLTAKGIQLDKLQALKARDVDATGELSLNASGQGTFDNPQLDATLQIPKLVIQNETITGVDLKMNVTNHVANATLASSAANTSIQAKAKVDLSGDYVTDATVDTQAIPLQPFLAVYAPEQAANITGQTELHATLHGPLKNKTMLEAHLSIPSLKMAYGSSVQLEAASPIRVDYKNGLVELQRATIRGTETNLEFQGSIPVGASGGKIPMKLLLLGTVNLKLVQLFDPDLRSSGEVKFNINSSGAASINSLGGQVEIVDAALTSSDLPVGLQHANGVLTLAGNRLTVTKFQGTVGGGTLTAQGGVSLQPSVHFDLGLAAKGVRMLYPQGVRENVNANLRLAGSADYASLSGSVNFSDVSFTPAFDLGGFINQFSGVETPPTPGFSQNLQLNLNVRSSNDLSLISRTLSVNGSANLQVHGTAANPVILGRVNLNSGDIILNGDRYLLNGGTVEFVNPSETQPVVNLSLKTTIQQYDIYLRFNGPIDQLRTNYNSDPALPSADIINLLAFGQTTEANSANQSPSANQTAASLVASQVSSQVTSRVSKIAGISQLSINPVLAGGSNQGPPGANITIQQRVTGNLFVTFSTNLSSSQSQTIQGQYQLSPRVALSATRDQNGGFAVDALIKKSW
jgi:translocation and assembly module TamB